MIELPTRMRMFTSNSKHDSFLYKRESTHVNVQSCPLNERGIEVIIVSNYHSPIYNCNYEQSSKITI